MTAANWTQPDVVPERSRWTLAPPAIARKSLRPSASLALEFVVALTGGFLVGAQVGHEPVVMLALVAWGVAAYHRGTEILGPLRLPTGGLVRGAGVVLAVLALVAGAGLIQQGALAASVLGTVCATVVAGGIRLRRRRRGGPNRALLIGEQVGVTQAMAQWAAQGDVEVAAVCVLTESGGRPLEGLLHGLGVPVLTSIEEVLPAVRGHQVDSVIVTPGPWIGSSGLRDLAWMLEGAEVSLGVMGAFDSVAPHRVSPARIGETLVLDVGFPRRSRWLRSVKSVTDRLLGALLLVLFAPVLVVLTVLIRLESPGPALFRQVRIGLGGNPFMMYKLRTMTVDAEDLRCPLRESEASTNVLFKMRVDPRVTRVGRQLRRFSLDELPQLLNVVKGQMSLIGPRPALYEEVELYDHLARRRLSVKPGLTGLWQVSGRSDLSWERSVALDVDYVDNWRLSDDLRIAARTVDAVVKSRGAY